MKISDVESGIVRINNVSKEDDGIQYNTTGKSPLH